MRKESLDSAKIRERLLLDRSSRRLDMMARKLGDLRFKAVNQSDIKYQDGTQKGRRVGDISMTVEVTKDFSGAGDYSCDIVVMSRADSLGLAVSWNSAHRPGTWSISGTGLNEGRLLNQRFRKLFQDLCVIERTHPRRRTTKKTRGPKSVSAKGAQQALQAMADAVCGKP